jgi:hypothetical protein
VPESYTGDLHSFYTEVDSEDFQTGCNESDKLCNKCYKRLSLNLTAWLARQQQLQAFQAGKRDSSCRTPARGGLQGSKQSKLSTPDCHRAVLQA